MGGYVRREVGLPSREHARLSRRERATPRNKITNENDDTADPTPPRSNPGTPINMRWRWIARMYCCCRGGRPSFENTRLNRHRQRLVTKITNGGTTHPTPTQPQREAMRGHRTEAVESRATTATRVNTHESACSGLRR